MATVNTVIAGTGHIKRALGSFPMWIMQGHVSGFAVAGATPNPLM
jgi:hypothetical protein